MTPSIPLAAATREILDAIHTRATVLTGVVDTVIYVCKDIKTIFPFSSKNGQQLVLRVIKAFYVNLLIFLLKVHQNIYLMLVKMSKILLVSQRSPLNPALHLHV